MNAALGGLESLPYRHALTVPAEGSAVRLARETLELVLAEWGVNPGHPSVDPALLILSELVTNGVRHAAELSPSITVIFAGGTDCLAFGVHDRHPHQPSLCAPRTGGGLDTVTELTLQLGGTAVVRADGDGRGKGIWITLPL
ncbi:anti-sigma regulatory factor [Streptomyces sp. VRA16 Mangrove soil]|uniref:ATP-binding protein n=1 Tax=Streptomyces sp. VRA16 Mangrove soil TaxID=2817434 RepID=UPI001A9FA5F2|nr:ATP-binding protein [Streptomyces sp. VRA16 Mangrove soil]MBO1336869.1 ATP-binding protein [Streptomyces sp. VRA16 Mangrove soil]